LTGLKLPDPPCLVMTSFVGSGNYANFLR